MIPDVRHEALIEETAAFRREHAATFGFDLAAIYRDLKEAERLSGRTYSVRRPRRLPACPAETGVPAGARPDG